MSSLEHLGVIMDGNSRWAKSRGLSTYHGHLEGTKRVKELIETVIKLKINHLSLYAFSTENWIRSEIEINNLFKIFISCLKEEIGMLMRYGVKFNFIGSYSKLSEDFIREVDFVRGCTKDNKILNLYVLFNYSGKVEILEACKKILNTTLTKNTCKGGHCDPDRSKSSIEKLTIEDFQNYLYSPEMPQVDLLIRTGNRNRISNFLPWHTAYSEIQFLEVLWPDFKYSNLMYCIENFKQSFRTFGSRF